MLAGQMRMRRLLLALLCLTGCEPASRYPAPPGGSFEEASFSVELSGSARTVSGAAVERSFFQSAKAAPLLGRAFVPDDHSGTSAVVVLGEALWREALGADPSVIGKRITVNGTALTVVGIMPGTFDSPKGAVLWVPRSEAPAK